MSNILSAAMLTIDLLIIIYKQAVHVFEPGSSRASVAKEILFWVFSLSFCHSNNRWYRNKQKRYKTIKIICNYLQFDYDMYVQNAEMEYQVSLMWKVTSWSFRNSNSTLKKIPSWHPANKKWNRTECTNEMYLHPFSGSI